MPHTIVALVADLLFDARIRGAAAAAGRTVATARTAAAVLDHARAGASLVLVDLDATRAQPIELIAALKGDAATAAIPLLAFGSHVHGELLAAARATGADRVLARSAFVRELPSLLAAAAAPAGDPPGS